MISNPLAKVASLLQEALAILSTPEVSKELPKDEEHECWFRLAEAKNGIAVFRCACGKFQQCTFGYVDCEHNAMRHLDADLLEEAANRFERGSPWQDAFLAAAKAVRRR